MKLSAPHPGVALLCGLMLLIKAPPIEAPTTAPVDHCAGGAGGEDSAARDKYVLVTESPDDAVLVNRPPNDIVELPVGGCVEEGVPVEGVPVAGDAEDEDMEDADVEDDDAEDDDADVDDVEDDDVKDDDTWVDAWGGSAAVEPVETRLIYPVVCVVPLGAQ
ncbi:MAG: hypothetical protein M1820_004147 [Bogoriella megaspora]|nr:MAG: hypothetical protein M1820_004147 [Bogoriella megaspora]